MNTASKVKVKVKVMPTMSMLPDLVFSIHNRVKVIHLDLWGMERQALDCPVTLRVSEVSSSNELTAPTCGVEAKHKI